MTYRKAVYPVTLTTTERSVHPSDVQLAWLLLTQNNDLPTPSSVTVESGGISITVDTAADVEAWAETMGVDADRELHADGTWTDRADGTVTVYPTFHSRRVLVDETVRVSVYRPAIAHEQAMVV